MGRSRVLALAGSLGVLVGAGGTARGEGPAAADGKGAAAEIRELERGCAGTAAERAKRQAATPLFARLGGEEKIQALTREIVRLHRRNEAIGHYFAKSDPDRAARRAAEFIISGTGGPSVYKGPDLRATHARMGISNRDFLVAGKDIVQAMTALGHGPGEVDEMMCTLVALRPQVVREDEVALQD